MKKIGLLSAAMSALYTLLFTVTPTYATGLTQQSQLLQPSDGFSLPDPTKIQYNVPPVGFDPLTASDSDLEKYHLLKRPTDPQELASWKYHMSRAKNFVIPQFKTLAKSAGPAKATSTTKTASSNTTATIQSSSNWSGYTVTTPNGGYQAISADWTVPSVAASAMTSESCTWAGIGGWGTNQLIQAGTDQQITTDQLGNLQSNYFFWWEALPQYPYMQELSMNVSPGDQVYVHVAYDPTHQAVTYEIQNLTTTQYTSFTSLNQSGNYDGSVAEWIVERPEYSTAPKYRALAYFNDVSFTNAYARDAYTGSYPLQSWGYNTTNMISNDGTIQLAHPYGLNSTAFHVSWDDYGP